MQPVADAVTLRCADGAIDLHQHVAFVHVVVVGDIDVLNPEKVQSPVPAVRPGRRASYNESGCRDRI